MKATLMKGLMFAFMLSQVLIFFNRIGFATETTNKARDQI